LVARSLANLVENSEQTSLATPLHDKRFVIGLIPVNVT
jgi:hypothetical protein